MSKHLFVKVSLFKIDNDPLEFSAPTSLGHPLDEIVEYCASKLFGEPAFDMAQESGKGEWKNGKNWKKR